MTEPNVIPVTPTDVDGVMSWVSHATVVEPRAPLTPDEIAAFRERGPLTPYQILERIAEFAFGDVE